MTDHERVPQVELDNDALANAAQAMCDFEYLSTARDVHARLSRKDTDNG